MQSRRVFPGESTDPWINQRILVTVKLLCYGAIGDTPSPMTSHLASLALNLVRLFAWLLLLMLIFVPLERLFAVRRQRVFRKAFGADVAYYFLSSLVPKFLLILPLSGFAWL